MGFSNEVADRNSKAGSNVIIDENRQVSLLNHVHFQLYRSIPHLGKSFCNLIFFSGSCHLRPPIPSPFCGQCCSERALLNRLMIELHKLDSDVLVGHNISGFDLDVLLHRAQVKIFGCQICILMRYLLYSVVIFFPQLPIRDFILQNQKVSVLLSTF